jgi:hypothetical protein
MGRHDGDENFGLDIGVVAVGAAITAVAILRQRGNPDSRWAGHSDRRRRLRVAKALRRGDLIATADVPVADALVATMRSQRFVYWFQPVLIASWLFHAVDRHGYGRWMYLSLALVLAVAVVWSLRVQRRSIRNWEAQRSGEPAAGDAREPVEAEHLDLG